ncbi:MAG TPA: HAD-IC family P-type ATPase [Lunatimonas sp.]|nr:HAD-IC family P-type ATPase [Lunatimonas sp.]
MEKTKKRSIEIDQKLPFHSSGVEDAMEALSADLGGLSVGEAKKRQELYGKNLLPEKKRSNLFLLFFNQFRSFLILILFMAAFITFIANRMTDVYFILTVIFFNAIMGFIHEFRAEKAIQAIKRLEQRKAIVIRDRKEVEIGAEDVVPGDVLVLKEGNTICADGRIFQARDLRTSEASLTGESMPVEKMSETVDENAAIGDRMNMVWQGTNIVSGVGKALVTAIANQTELGKIAKSMVEMEKQSSLFRRKTDFLGKQMAGFAIFTSFVVFGFAYWVRNYDFEETLLLSIAFLVSSIPEGLPAIITIVLAIGANRMAKKNVIIREFGASEMMGAVSVILTDKTGTITRSILVVKKIFTGMGRDISVSGIGFQFKGGFFAGNKEIELEKNPVELKLISIAAFCNDAHLKGEDNQNKEVEIAGDPTEAAMFVIGEKAGIRDRSPFDRYEVIDEIPFKSEQKFRASLVKTENSNEVFVIGAPEKLLEMSRDYLTIDGPAPMDVEKQHEIQRKIHQWTGEALRVLGMGFKDVGDVTEISSNDINDLTWVGIVGIIDPPKKGVLESVQECKEAGIRVIMVTGDHKRTATAIAEQVGILNGSYPKEENGYPVSLTTTELNVNDDKFDEYLEHVNVFARMNPDIKLRIAERLQAKGVLIAMTGDGINDAPALKKAYVGVSMGIRGTEVAKDASQIILQDDNFSSIVNAVREGRIVFNNVRIYSYYMLTTTFAFVVAYIASFILGFPLILTAVQVLYVNLVTSGIMNIGLATEPGHKEIMKRPPLMKDEQILKSDVIPYIIIVSVVLGSLVLLTFQYYLPEGEKMARTGTFVMASMIQIFHLFNMRSTRSSLFEIGPFSNIWVNVTFSAAVILQLLVVKSPFFQKIMGFENFPVLDFFVIFGLGTLIVWIVEIYKYFKFGKSPKEK